MKYLQPTTNYSNNANLIALSKERIAFLKLQNDYEDLKKELEKNNHVKLFHNSFTFLNFFTFLKIF